MKGLVASALVAALGGAQERRDVPRFPSRAELVTVDAVVLDGAGRPVRGLTAEDFTLSEDGRPQAIVSFETIDAGAAEAGAAAVAAPGPVATNVRPARASASSFVLLVDDAGLAPSRQEVVRTALARFLAEGVRDGDELIFATTSGDAWWAARMPEGREDVLALAGRVRGRSLADTGPDAVSEWEAFRISHWEGRGDDAAAAGSAGPPSGSLAPPPGVPTSTVAGTSVTQRVVDRYYQRRVCIPDVPGGTPREVCRGLVFARAQQVDARRRNRTRDVLAAVDRAVFALTGVRGRKALLLLTEGFLNDPDLDVGHEAAGRCREANLAVYSLDVRGLVTGLATADALSAPNTAELGTMQAEQVEAQAAGSVALAEDTGGFAVRDTNDLGGGAARIAEESRVYYLLGYAPPEGKGPRDWRRLQVKVTRPGFTVRARKGYTLRTAAEMAAAAEARGASAGRSPSAPVDVVRALAGVRDADAIPLRAMAYAFEGRPGGTVRTLIVVEARMGSLANVGSEERPYSVVSLGIATAHRDTGQVQRLDQRIDVAAATAGGPRNLASWEGGWLTLSREFELPPGVAQARIVMRDEFLGRLGALTLRFEVPPAAGLRLSSPLLTNRVAPRKEGGPSRPILVAHREFAAEGRLFCQFEVLGAAPADGGAPPRVEASYTLRGRHGDVVRRGESSLVAPTADGRLVRLLALALDAVAPGDYELVLRVEDKTTGQARERVEPLRITAPGRS